VAAAVSTLSFILLVMLPGDLALKVAMARYGEDLADEQAAAYVRREEGLDRPLWFRYGVWIKDTVTFNLGRSLVTGNSVADDIRFHFGMTTRLAVCSMILSLFLAAPWGIFAGLRPGSYTDLASVIVSGCLVSIPSFVLGAVLIILFAVKLRWVPAAGFMQASNLILPSMTLALGLAAVSSRVIRTATVEVKGSFFITFARLKGLSAYRVFYAHGVRNAAIPVVTFLGLQLAHLLDGIVVLENLFDWPGIGNLLIQAIVARDLPIIQGTTLVIGLMYVTVNAVTDMICLWLDPRQGTGK